MSDSKVWPEWSNDKINAEKWNASKGDATKFFEDPHTPTLPTSLKPHSWKRPHLISSTEPVLFMSSSTLPNLFINNQHIFHCQFIKWFISSLTTLHYYGREGLRITETSNFTWKFRNKPWKGWYHIYSLNKVDKKSLHNPLINPYGKYIVRLFFCGTWRSIVVDDLIPLDNEGNPLLPRTEINEELWPIILAKAMLKIISTTWKSFEDIDEEEINESINVNLIYLLTGWTCLSLDISHLYPYDRWELLSQYVAQFTDLNNLKDDISVEKSDKISRTSVENNDEGKKNRKKSKSSAASIETLEKKKKDEGANDRDVLTLLLFKNFEKKIEEHNIFSDYPIHTKLISDISLDPTEAQSPIESWNRHRWFCWASQQGVMNPIDYTTPTRLVLLFTPFLYHHQSQSSLHDDKENKNPFFTWFDFNKLSKYSMEIIFLFKAKKFKYSINISDVIETNSSNHNNNNKLFKNYQYLHQPTDLDHQNRSSRNEPLYFVIDSLEPKCVIFNFNVYPDIKKSSVLIVEKHCWLTRTVDEQPLLKIRTIMSSSKILFLDSGRYLLRIFIQSLNSYHLTIQSNTMFEVGNREEIQNLMVSESETSKIFIGKIKRSLISAFNAFGSNDYRNNLKAYYQSYLPEYEVLEDGERSYTINKMLSLAMHRYFKKALVNCVCRRFSGDDRKNILQSLRIFFIDPSLGRINLYAYDEMMDDDQFNLAHTIFLDNFYQKLTKKGNTLTKSFYNEAENEAAIIIQSFWKMLRVKRYWDIHTLDSNEDKRKEVKDYLDLIIAILDKGFIYDLMQDVFREEHEIDYFYPISDDLPYILNITEIKGKVSSSSNNFLPIFRFIIKVPEHSIIFAAFDLFIDLPVYFLRVFNNDTCREIQNKINRVLPYHYSQNHTSYTVICYGWIHSPGNSGDNRTSINRSKSRISQKKEFEWTLHIVSPKGDPEFIFAHNERNQSIPSSIDLPDLKIKKISNNYIPNMSKRIFRIAIETSRSCSIALKIIPTCDKVLMEIRLLNSKNKLLEKFLGRPKQIIPSVYLEKSGLFYIESLILKNSWPLTEEEWNTVKNIKEEKSYRYRNFENNNLAGVSMKNGDQKKIIIDKKILKAPYWIVEVLISEEDIIDIYEDNSNELKINEIKESCFAGDLARLEEGKVIREAFVEKFGLKRKKDEWQNVD